MHSLRSNFALLRRTRHSPGRSEMCADIRFEIAELRALMILARAKITSGRTEIRILAAQGERDDKGLEKGPQALGH
jgi:hypothetical protein